VYLAHFRRLDPSWVYLARFRRLDPSWAYLARFRRLDPSWVYQACRLDPKVYQAVARAFVRAPLGRSHARPQCVHSKGCETVNSKVVSRLAARAR
jgi:hypothetical protein